MKRRLVYLTLMMIAVLTPISGCGSSSGGSGEITERMRSITSADMRAAVFANFPEREAQYTIDYHYDRDGVQKITVIKPEIIAGVTVSVQNGETAMEFDGVRLETGRLDSSGLSPLSAISSLMNAWIGGNVAESASSKHDGADCTLIISRHTAGDVELEYRTWFEKASLSPLYAEIYSGGNRVIQCEFERVEYS